jgi:hypothetical protein
MYVINYNMVKFDDQNVDFYAHICTKVEVNHDKADDSVRKLNPAGCTMSTDRPHTTCMPPV